MDFSKSLKNVFKKPIFPITFKHLRKLRNGPQLEFYWLRVVRIQVRKIVKHIIILYLGLGMEQLRRNEVPIPCKFLCFPKYKKKILWSQGSLAKQAEQVSYLLLFFRPQSLFWKMLCFKGKKFEQRRRHGKASFLLEITTLYATFWAANMRLSKSKSYTKEYLLLPFVRGRALNNYTRNMKCERRLKHPRNLHWRSSKNVSRWMLFYIPWKMLKLRRKINLRDIILEYFIFLSKQRKTLRMTHGSGKWIKMLVF